MSDQRVEDDVDLHVAPRRFRQFSRSAPQEEAPRGRLAPRAAREVVVDHKAQHEGHVALVRLRAPGDVFAHADAFAEAAF